MRQASNFDPVAVTKEAVKEIRARTKDGLETWI